MVQVVFLEGFYFCMQCQRLGFFNFLLPIRSPAKLISNYAKRYRRKTLNIHVHALFESIYFHL